MGKFNTVIAPIVGGLIIILLGLRQLKMDDPFLDIRVFKIRQFTLVTLALALSTMAMMGVEMMLPLYLQDVHGLSAFNSGLVLLPGSLMMAVVAPLAGGVYDRIGSKRLAVIGFLVLALVLYHLCSLQLRLLTTLLLFYGYVMLVLVW
ncbi:Antiseptic resistance protein [Lactococcus lactis]|nr:Antiseptic resistance protein [Lactococcus lactis]